MPYQHVSEIYHDLNNQLYNVTSGFTAKFRNHARQSLYLTWGKIQQDSFNTVF